MYLAQKKEFMKRREESLWAQRQRKLAARRGSASSLSSMTDDDITSDIGLYEMSDSDGEGGVCFA